MKVSLKDVKKVYDGSKTALDGVCLDLPERGLVFLLGKSGCGKTTLLNLLAGLDSPTSGELSFNGKNVGKLSEQQWDEIRARRLGIVFQEYNLYPDLTVEENLRLAMGVCDDDRADVSSMDTILSQTGVLQYKNTKVQKLSGGEKQRVAIARCLIKAPEVILADEPTGNLDTENSEIVFGVLKELSEKCLVLVVTHDVESAHKYSDRIVKLQDGKVISDDESMNGASLRAADSSDNPAGSEQAVNAGKLPAAIKWRLAHVQLKVKKGKLTAIILALSLISCLVVWIGLVLTNQFGEAVSDYFQKARLPYAEVGLKDNRRNEIGEVNRQIGKAMAERLSEVWEQDQLLKVRFYTQIWAEETDDIPRDARVALVTIPKECNEDGFDIAFGHMPSAQNDLVLTEKAANQLNLSKGDIGKEIWISSFRKPMVFCGMITIKDLPIERVDTETALEYYENLYNAAFVCESAWTESNLEYIEVQAGDFSQQEVASHFAGSVANYTGVSMMERLSWPGIPVISSGTMPERSNEVAVSYDLAQRLGLINDEGFQSKEIKLRSVRSLKSADYSMCFDICEYFGDSVVVVGITNSSVDVVVIDEVYHKMCEEYCKNYYFDGYFALSNSFSPERSEKLFKDAEIRVLEPDLNNVYAARERQEELKLYLYLLFGILVAVLVLMSAAFIWSNAKDNHRKIGILRSLGISRRDVASVFLLEALFTGVLAAVIGLAGGNLLFALTRRNSERGLFWYFDKITIWRVNWRTVILLTAAQIVFSVVGAAIAASIISKKKTVDLLKE